MAGSDTVANAVSEIVEQAVDSESERRVEAAVERAEAAEATAQALTDAAIMTRLGETVDRLSGEVEKCQSEMASLRTTVETTQAKILEISSAQAAQPAAVILTPPTPSPEPSAPRGTDQPQMIQPEA